jgi:predicted naringenin-chalcone synthase
MITQIAQAANVAERSIYRDFGNWSMLVLHVEVDQQTIDAFAQNPDGRDVVVAVRETLDLIDQMMTPGATADAVRKLDLVEQHP